jgi:hypothetical protein
MQSKNLDFLFDNIEFTDYIAVFGEWCGGNIQKGVALTSLPKMFVLFSYCVDGVWKDSFISSPDQGVYNVNQFPTWAVDIDFNNPELIQNKLVELTISVEDKCPAGEFFGSEGVGEGIVFTCVTDPELKFKSKGEKHSASKVKVLNAVDTEELETIKEFIEYSVTESRLSQGLQYMKENGLELHQKNTGIFISWVVKDILKEESDTIEKNGIDMKKANSQIAFKAKAFLFNSL